LSQENWHEERDRLERLLQDLESGTITRMHEGDLPELQATTPENVAVLKVRLAQLNARIGDHRPLKANPQSSATTTETRRKGRPPSADAT